ncbi:MAG: hypothetical protein ACRDJV_02690 [Actinomycetota bacterium]
MFRSRLVSAALSVAVIGGLAACGNGGDTVAAEDYAADVCGAVKDYTDTVSERVSEIQSEAPEDPEAGKEVLTNFLGDMVGDTDTLISEVEDAGVPDVDNGEEIADDVRSALGQVKSILEDAQSQIEDLPTDDPQAFAEGTQEIGTSLQESGQEVQSGLEGLQSSELEEASQDIEVCQEIQAGFAP